MTEARRSQTRRPRAGFEREREMPTRGVIKPSRAPIRTLTDSVQFGSGHLILIYDPAGAVLFVTAARTGARWGELTGLQRHNLHLFDDDTGSLVIDPDRRCAARTQPRPALSRAPRPRSPPAPAPCPRSSCASCASTRPDFPRPAPQPQNLAHRRRRPRNRPSPPPRPRPRRQGPADLLPRRRRRTTPPRRTPSPLGQSHLRQHHRPRPHNLARYRLSNPTHRRSQPRPLDTLTRMDDTPGAGAVTPLRPEAPHCSSSAPPTEQ